MNIFKTALKAILEAKKETLRKAEMKAEWEKMVNSGSINVKEFNKKYLTKV